MTTQSPRIDPVTEPYSDEVAAELGRWMPPNSPVEPLALFRTLCRNVGLSEAMRPLGEFQLSKRSGLSMRVRELVIDRTTARLDAEYEWGVHAVAYGVAAGLSEADLANTVSGGADDYDTVSGLVVEMVDELVTTHTVSDGLWARLSAEFSDDEILELLVLCGWYHIISFVVNATGVAPETWAATFPTVEATS